MGKTKHLSYYSDEDDEYEFTSRKKLAKLAKLERSNRHKREIKDADIKFVTNKKPT